MIVAIISIVVIVAIIFIYLKKKVLHSDSILPTGKPVIQPLFTRSNNMENLKISWSLSPSTIVESQQVFIAVNGAASAQVGTDLASNISELLVSYPAGTTIVVTVQATGDNGTKAMSAPSDPFPVKDLMVVVAPGKPGIAWLSHTD
jgi:hypothetical protein